MVHDYCTCGADRVSCIDCAENKIDRLSTQLAEAAKAAEEMELALQKASDEFRKQLAERDKLIENQQAEIESRNQLRYDALKGEHSRSPYYYDSWCKLHDHKGVVGTSDKPPIYYAVNLLNKLTEQNAALREEVKRLKLIISGKTFVDERKLVAQEIIQYIIDQGKVAFGSLSARDYVYDIIDSDIEELRQRYGLEG